MVSEDLRQSIDDCSDEELVELFKAGHEWAYDGIAKRYAARVLSLCFGFLRDHHQSCDASQEVLLKIHRSLAGFRGNSKLSTWIHTIAVNTCKNRLSFWRRLFAARRSYDADPLVSRVHDSPEERVLELERVRLVRQAIAELPLLHREIIVLKDIQGCSYEEIGQVLSLTPGTVKSRLHRARDALAKKLQSVFGAL